MIMNKGYLDEMKERIWETEEGYFARRRLTKEAVLNDTGTMERLWAIYQKDVEDYDCDRAFSLDDAMNEVFGPEPKKAKPKYRCPFCGSERFIGHQVIRADVYVDGNGEFDDNLPGELEANIYDSGNPYGPFTCVKCGQEFGELPEYQTVRLARGTFTIVSGMDVWKAKEAGYGYHHGDGGYSIVSGRARSATRTMTAITAGRDCSRYSRRERRKNMFEVGDIVFVSNPDMEYEAEVGPGRTMPFSGV